VIKSTLLFALALAGMEAHAATIVVAQFNGEITSEAIQRFIVNDPTNPGWVDTTTGEFSFTRVDGGTIDPAASFLAFCIEPREFVSSGSTYTYSLVPLAQGTTNIGGMGQAKADLLSELFGRYYPVLNAPLDAVHASAMQIAIWEIVRETSGTLDVSSGNISFRNPADAPALALAQTYLSSLNGTGPRAINLYALDEVGAQDVIVQIQNPEPATIILMGVALIGVAVVLRKRTLAHATKLT
jgi:hypothetical protein